MKNKKYLVFYLSIFLLAGCKSSLAKNIKPSDELMKADLFDMVLNFDGNEIKLPITVEAFQESPDWKTN